MPCPLSVILYFCFYIKTDKWKTNKKQNLELEVEEKDLSQP